MSDIVQSTVISYFDSQNAALKYNSEVIPVIHTDNNAGEKEEGGIGPFIKTSIIEQSWNKINSSRHTVTDSDTQCSMETGQFIIEIHAQGGYGDRDLRIQQKVADLIKKDFVQLDLETANSEFIRFGESTSRPPFFVDRAKRGQRQWWQLNLFINYAYSESYTN
jgi:hypothetical protein